MADLSAYIDFSVQLDKSVTTPVIRLTDTGTYPAGVTPYITGVFSVTQPDGISVTGTFTSPDISGGGGTATKELRLSTTDTIQNGIYSITYTIDCIGYDTTILTKTFTIAYTAPTVIITILNDVFTPQIQAVDGSIYAQAGFTTTSTTRAWSADIKYVSTTVQTVTGTALLFDMAYATNYYDAFYAISLNVTVVYTMTGSYTWVSVKDLIEATSQLDAFTPPTLAALQLSLNDLKTAIENDTYCGGCGCGCTPNYGPWEKATALYQNIVTNGQDGNVTGLDSQVDQLIKIFNCSGIIVRDHTNDVIPPYDWGTTQTFSLHIPIQFTVGSGGLYVPANGATSYINPTLAGNNNYLIFLKGQADFLVEGTDFSYRVGGGFDLITDSFISGDRWTLSFYA